jgi:cysteinyl-tRNA synthetase
VYDRAHIGNLRAFLFVDLLKRWLEFNNFQVTHVMNLTDVDDKTIRRSRERGISLGALTEECAQAFFSDLQRLGIKPATVYPRATEHITQMVELTKRLLASGHAYTKEGSVYYRISSFPDYGRFARLDFAGMQAGASGVDADEYGKENVNDFALWKAHKPETDGDVYWETDIGRGRPGWHIECSAMSMQYLGETFDIHTGGVDLIFPHHQNEIAQSEGATGRQFVKYWLHSEHLLLGGDKMAKSAGTAKNLDDIVKSPADLAAFRYLMLSAHYQAKMNFTEEALDAARRTVQRLVNLHSALKTVGRTGESQLADSAIKAGTKFVEAMNNNMSAPQALAAIFEFISPAEKLFASDQMTKSTALDCLSLLGEFNSIFGVLDLAQTNLELHEESKLTTEQAALIEARQAARTGKQWQRADEIRARLLSQGIRIKDTATGPQWERVA